VEDWIDELRSAAGSAVPPVEGSAAIPGLTRPVEVLRDRWGVPHVYASSVDDLFRAQGFVVASERLFQIEFLLRLAGGRLAELVGELALPLDRFARTIGWNRAGPTVVEGWDDDSRAMMTAFREGAAAWLDSMPAPPIEYAILGRAPELPMDDASWAAGGVWMAWNLSGNWDEELLRAEILDRLGPEALQDLFPDLPNVPDLPVAGRRGGPSATDLLGGAPRRPAGQGSNNWVVSGSRSVTGAPLLANDPHLAVLMPSIWIECHLSAPDYEAAGVALPFAPGVVIGRTAHHAWGFTNVGGDTQDLYLERLNAEGTAAAYRGGWEPLTVHREEIAVAGRSDPEVLEVRETRHGPILDSYVVGISQPRVVEGGIRETYALRWTGAECAILPSTLLRMARATSFEGFRDAVSGWEAPGQNMLYADVGGTIGYQCTGRYPIRRSGNGTMPVPGWTDEHEWVGWVPFEELPWDVDPPEGVLATANDRIHGDDYTHLIGVDFAPPSRIRRIGELLGAAERHSPETFAAMHADTLSIPARELVPRLISLTPTDARQGSAIALLEAWDADLAADSAAACVYEAWSHHLAERLLRPALGDELFTHYYGLPQGGGTWRPVVLPALLDDPSDRWFGQGDRAEVLREAFDDALDELEIRLGPDPRRWRWGDLHRVTFAGPLAMVPGLEELFTGGVVGKGGDDDTIDAGTFEPERRYDAVVVASWRQIQDLSGPDASVGTNTTGQSGHPASQHWNDLLPLWAAGAYHPLPLTREAIEHHATGTTTLRPR
jgi:penicillin amidase